MSKEASQLPDAQHFTITDPKTFDANPYEVAERAVGQLEALTALMRGLLATSELMARNAEMTRRMDLGGLPEGDRWVEEPQGRQWEALRQDLEVIQRRLRALKLASGFDPRHAK